MKYCEEYAALISAGVDNALTADERKQLMDHLAQCPACREAYTQMLTMHEAFADWDEEVPGDLAGSVMEQIRKETTVTKRRKRSWLPLAAAAACCALVFIGYRNMDTAKNTADNAVSFRTEITASTAESADVTVTADTAAADDAAEDTGDSVAFTASVEDILFGDSEEQLLDGVLTYFRSAPEDTAPEDTVVEAEKDVAEPAAAADEPQELTVLTCHDSALAEWMEANTQAEGYTEEGTTAWLITVDEYEALLDYLTAEEIDWEQTLVETLSDQASDMICVVYLPS